MSDKVIEGLSFDIKDPEFLEHKFLEAKDIITTFALTATNWEKIIFIKVDEESMIVHCYRKDTEKPVANFASHIIK